jgi:uncharacterized membrane protein
MQCPVCHNEVGSQSAFCPHCGAQLSAAAPSQAPPPNYSAPPPGSSATGLAPTAAAAIAYITCIPAIIFLLVEPYNKMPLVRFHSFQSIGLAVVGFVVQVCFNVLGWTMFTFMFMSALHTVVYLVLFIFWIIALLSALRGEWYKLPIIGDFAMKQAQS